MLVSHKEYHRYEYGCVESKEYQVYQSNMVQQIKAKTKMAILNLKACNLVSNITANEVVKRIKSISHSIEDVNYSRNGVDGEIIKAISDGLFEFGTELIGLASHDQELVQVQVS
jgi:hypothetical protein